MPSASMITHKPLSGELFSDPSSGIDSPYVLGTAWSQAWHRMYVFQEQNAPHKEVAASPDGFPPQLERCRVLAGPLSLCCGYVMVLYEMYGFVWSGDTRACALLTPGKIVPPDHICAAGACKLETTEALLDNRIHGLCPCSRAPK